MNRQQRQAKLKEINEHVLCPRILAVIRGEPVLRQISGLAGAFAQVLVDSQLPQEDRANFLRGMIECLITEMAVMDGLNMEQMKDRLIAKAMHEPPAGTA